MYTVGSYAINFDNQSIKDSIIMATKKQAPVEQTTFVIDGDLNAISDADLAALQKKLKDVQEAREAEKAKLIQKELQKDLERIEELQATIRDSLAEIATLGTKHDLEDITVYVGDFSVTLEDGDWISSYY